MYLKAKPIDEQQLTWHNTNTLKNRKWALVAFLGPMSVDECRAPKVFEIMDPVE